MKKGIIALTILCTGLLALIPIKDTSFAKEDNSISTNITNKVEIDNVEKEDSNIDVLNKEQAQNLLKEINPDIEYLYQGDENTFTVLKEKNLSGYVFLPNVDGDMGYFVDKNDSHIYLFHPSGYLELYK
ncbi:MAG: hypothetical protein IJH34_17015 [Romboutsia sp.]|nr:hypothetical protein [Romboutsia sp.]